MIPNFLELTELEEIKKELTGFLEQERKFEPFDPLLIDFSEVLSQKFFELKNSKEGADFVALAFWLRKSHIKFLSEKYFANNCESMLLMPRGIAFHLPPSNLEVMIVYSWITSLLVGNFNIIRLPSKDSKLLTQLMIVIKEILADQKFDSIAKSTVFIRYGHEEAVTSWLSSKSDLRIVWGGDETVNLIRKIALPPQSKDFAFPDRTSCGAIESAHYLKLNDYEKTKLAESFFKDVFLFDQSACSSPRLIYWIGSAHETESASKNFYQQLQEIIVHKGFEITLGAALLKNTFIYDQALSLPVKAVHLFSNELSVVALNKGDSKSHPHCGQGLLYHLELHDLSEISKFINSHYQTLTYAGFSLQKLQNFVKLVKGKGFTRVVPFGQALNFEAVWDGQDLLTEFSQHILIEGLNETSI